MKSSGNVLSLRAVAILFIFCCGMISGACGKKSDPIVHVPLIPGHVRSFRAAVRPEAVLLVWKPPRENMNGTPLLDLAGFRIYRSETDIEKVCLKCPRSYRFLFDYRYNGTRGKPPGSRRLIYFDRSISFGSFYTYRIIPYTEKGITGKPSKELDVYCVSPPPPPVSVRAEREGGTVRLSWRFEQPASLPAGLVVRGYNIYRRNSDNMYGLLPINEKIVSETVFTDVPGGDNETYYYRVCTVAMMKSTIIESIPSEEVKVRLVDLTAPSVPEGLTVIPRADGVYLKWIPVVDEDCAGYNVYRKDKGRVDFERLNDRLVKGGTWIDRTARRNATYVYGVTSVDMSPAANESNLSETVKIKYVYR